MHHFHAGGRDRVLWHEGGRKIKIKQGFLLRRMADQFVVVAVGAAGAGVSQHDAAQWLGGVHLKAA